MRSISENATYSILTQIPTQIFAILSSIIITRILGPEGKGFYAIFYANVSLFATALDFSILNAIIYFVASGKMGIGKIKSIGFYFSLVSISLSFLLILLWKISPFADDLFPEAMSNWKYLALLALFLVITQINTFFSAFFQGINNFKIVNRVLMLSSLFNLIVFGIAFVVEYYTSIRLTINHILVMGFVSLCIFTLMWFVEYRVHFRQKIDWKISWKNDIRPFLTFSGFDHISTIFDFLNIKIVLWILALHTDFKTVGIFSVALGLTQLLHLTSAPLMQLLMPYLSNKDVSNKNVVFISFARLHFSFLILFGLIGILLSKWFIPLLYGQEFTAATEPFNILIFGIVCSFQTRVFATYFLAEGKAQLKMVLSCITLLITVILLVVFIPKSGIYGAAVGQSIAFFVTLLVYFILIVSGPRIGSFNLFIVTPTDIKLFAQKFLTHIKTW